jgi:hypothetical protein
LRHAYELARENAGAAGVDGMTFAQIEAAISNDRAALPCRSDNYKHKKSRPHVALRHM